MELSAMAFWSEKRGGRMHKQGSLAARWTLIAAIAVGLSHLWPVIGGFSGAAIVAWKGAGVGLLALYAAMLARNADGWLIAAVMAFCALGDVLLDAVGLTVGAGAFAIGHLFAIALYVRNRRATTTFSQKLTAATLAIGTPLIGYQLTELPEVAFYSAILGVMAGTAWLSRFPRYRTGIGAAMFVASDLLIFARLSAVADQSWANPAIWGLYFVGQALIVLGVTRTLRQQS
jgi:uncharacterized membrane protein YhhN